MQALQNLAIFFLVTQVLSGLMLVIGVQYDEDTFLKLGFNKYRTRPGVVKSARLFSSTSRPGFMAVYLLSLIFVIFSYAAVLMLAGQSIFLFFN